MPGSTSSHIVHGALIGITAIGVAACAGNGSSQVTEGLCDATAVEWAVGATADQATLGKVWRGSGAGLIRPVSPGQAVLRDHRPDRVTVEIDGANRIVAIRCE